MTTDNFSHKHASTEGLRPSPEYLQPGEIALNISEQTPGLFFKDSEGAVRKVGPAQYSNNPPPGESVGEMWINPLSNNSISIWDGEEWSPAGAVGAVGKEPPAEPGDGQLWYDLVGNELKTYVGSLGEWVSHRDESTGIGSINNLAMGVGTNPYEIFVDPYVGTDSFSNEGTDPRRPFRTLNRAIIEAGKLSILRGVSNDEYDRILITCRNGLNVVYNSVGIPTAGAVTLSRNWGDINYQRFVDGANLLTGNRDWIVSRSFNALATAYYSEYTSTEEFQSKTPRIKKYLSGLVEAVSKDLKSGGNKNVLKFAKSFYNGDGVLIAFGEDISIKDLFLNVAYPVALEKISLTIENKGAQRDDTLTPDRIYDSPCSNVKQAALTLLDIFFRTLTGSLSLDVKESVGSNPTEPSASILEQFNDPIFGGVVIPRGVSIQGVDLRKTVITPSYVPGEGEEDNRSIFRFTGGSFFFNFTFKDNPGVERSHHRLRCFTFATESQLDLFYKKVATAFELDTSDAEVRNPETDIVFSSSEVDTSFGSSPYVFNCSVRSDYGLSGIEADGSLVGGLKSIVAAQFTNVSLQRDPKAWEVYDGVELEWRDVTSYQEVIDTPVENVRFKKDFRNFAFKVTNGAYAQLVSCFCIGCAVNYWTSFGGDISITNSTSNFGGTSCLSVGFLGQGTTGGALPQDSDFAVEAIVRPLRLPITAPELPANSAQRIKLGVFSNFDSSNPAHIDLYLQDNLFLSSLGGYTLGNRSRKIYFVDTTGNERMADVIGFPLASSVDPNNLGSVLRLNPATDISGWEGQEGREVFIKRFIDFRGLSERAYRLRVRTTKTGTRRPQINFIFRLISGGTVGQTQIIRSGSQLDNIISGQRGYVFYVANVEDVAATETETEFDTFDITILGLDSFEEWDEEYLYARGDIVSYNEKLYKSLDSQNKGNPPDTSKKAWQNVGIQQDDETGCAVDSTNAIIRQRLDIDNGTESMGLSRDDYDSYSQNHSLKALDRFLEILGYNNETRSQVLSPQEDEFRLYDPTNLPTPQGGAALRSNNFPVEFNRSSLIRASGQTFEWVGYYNYSKAIPSKQNSVLSPGNRESALSRERYGGRVYAAGLTEEGESFQNGKIVQRVSGLEDSPDFEPVNTGIVSKVSNLQVGACEIPDPQSSWLATDNLKVCGEIVLSSSSAIRNRFWVPFGVRAAYGNGTRDNANGIQFGLARPATQAEAESGLDNEGFLTSFLLKKSSKFEIGRISYFPRNTLTLEQFKYFLICDGSLVNKSSFPQLYNYMRGVDYDAAITSSPNALAILGETTTLFRLPDLRGKFVRGWSGAIETRGSSRPANGLDAGRNVSSDQEDALGSHSHPVNDPGHSHSFTGRFRAAGDDNNYTLLDNGGTLSTGAAGTGITIGNSGGSETRPYNIALLPVIRYV